MKKIMSITMTALVAMSLIALAVYARRKTDGTPGHPLQGF